MKKILKINLVIIIMLCVFLCLSKVKAEEPPTFFTPISIEITNVSSDSIKTGDTINITLKSQNDTKQQLNQFPTLIIQFGNGEEIELETITEELNTATLEYSYKITDNDIGELKILSEKQVISNGTTSMGINNVPVNRNIIANEDKIQIEWTDFSRATFEWIDYTEKSHATPSLKINNVEFNDEYSYFVYLSNDKNAITDTSSLTGLSDFEDWISFSNGVVGIRALENVIEKNGDIYIWIAEYQENEGKVLLIAKEVERLEQLPLGKRIIGYIQNIDTKDSIYVNEPFSVDTRSINYKIGEIADREIISKVINNENGALQELLNYAKNKQSLDQGNIKLQENEQSIIDGINLKDKAYYFVYYEAEDENGTYYPIEDIALVQAIKYNDGWTLVNYTDDRFSFEQENNNQNNNQNNNDDTVAGGKLPQTGETISICIAVTALIILAIAVGYVIKKNRDIK